MMKRIIFIALLLSFAIVSQAQNQQIVYTSGVAVTYKVPATYFQTWPKAGQPGSDFYYITSIFTGRGLTGWETAFVKGMYNSGLYNTAVGGESLGKVYPLQVKYTLGPVPPYGDQGIIILNFFQISFEGTPFKETP